VAGPLFLVSVGLNTWASILYLHGLGWELVGGGQVPWPSVLARGPYGWAQVATFVVTGLLIVILAVAVRDQLPRRRMSSFAVVLLALLGVALMLAAFRVDTPMLRGGNPNTWNGWVHGIAFLLIIALGVLAPLSMALAVRGDPSWRPTALVSLAAAALFVVFLLLPWGQRLIPDGRRHSVCLDRNGCCSPPPRPLSRGLGRCIHLPDAAHSSCARRGRHRRRHGRRVNPISGEHYRITAADGPAIDNRGVNADVHCVVLGSRAEDS
jgi:hypothetical protein